MENITDINSPLFPLFLELLDEEEQKQKEKEEKEKVNNYDSKRVCK